MTAYAARFHTRADFDRWLAFWSRRVGQAVFVPTMDANIDPQEAIRRLEAVSPLIKRMTDDPELLNSPAFLLQVGEILATGEAIAPLSAPTRGLAGRHA